MAVKLNLSAMQISRATRQLKELGLMSMRKEGVRIVLYSEEKRRDLFERSKPFLLNPIRKKLFVDHGDVPEGLPLSGISALSELTMLGEPSTKMLAYFGKSRDLNGSNTLIDSNQEVEIEVWKYNSSLLTEKADIVDSVSLAVSLKDDDDPRVEHAVEQIIEKVFAR